MSYDLFLKIMGGPRNRSFSEELAAALSSDPAIVPCEVLSLYDDASDQDVDSLTDLLDQDPDAVDALGEWCAERASRLPRRARFVETSELGGLRRVRHLARRLARLLRDRVHGGDERVERLRRSGRIVSHRPRRFSPKAETTQAERRGRKARLPKFDSNARRTRCSGRRVRRLPTWLARSSAAHRASRRSRARRPRVSSRASARSSPVRAAPACTAAHAREASAQPARATCDAVRKPHAAAKSGIAVAESEPQSAQEIPRAS